jgi:hypothetical protein
MSRIRHRGVAHHPARPARAPISAPDELPSYDLDGTCPWAPSSVELADAPLTPTLSEAEAHSGPPEQPGAGPAEPPDGADAFVLPAQDGDGARSGRARRSLSGASDRAEAWHRGSGADVEEGTSRITNEIGLSTTRGRSALSVSGGVREDLGEGTSSTVGGGLHLDGRNPRLGFSYAQDGEGGSTSGDLSLGVAGVGGSFQRCRADAGGGTRQVGMDGTVGLQGARLSRRHTHTSDALTWSPAEAAYDQASSPRAQSIAERTTGTAQVRATASRSSRAALSAHAERVRPHGDRYAVDYQYELGFEALAQAGLAAQAMGLAGVEPEDGAGETPTLQRDGGRALGDGGSIGAQAMIGVRFRVSGTRLFTDEGAAEAFYLTPVGEDALMPFTPDAARSLREGESRRIEVIGQAGLGAGGGTRTLDLSAGVEGSIGAGLTVRAVGGGRVHVTSDRTRDAAIRGGASTFSLGVGGQATVGERVQGGVSLDLHTEGGRAAYRAILAGRPPEMGPGVALLDRSESSSSGLATTVDLPIGQLRVGADSTDTITERPDGSRRVSERGGTSTGLTTPPWLDPVVPGFQDGLGAEAATEYDRDGVEKGTGVFVLGETESWSASLNRKAIGQPLGIDDSGTNRRGAVTPGRWSFAVDYGDDAIDRLRTILSRQQPEWRPARLLRDALLQTDDTAAARQAIQDFAAHGHRPASPSAAAWAGVPGARGQRDVDRGRGPCGGGEGDSVGPVDPGLLPG